MVGSLGRRDRLDRRGGVLDRRTGVTAQLRDQAAHRQPEGALRRLWIGGGGQGGFAPLEQPLRARWIAVPQRNLDQAQQRVGDAGVMGAELSLDDPELRIERFPGLHCATPHQCDVAQHMVQPGRDFGMRRFGGLPAQLEPAARKVESVVDVAAVDLEIGAHAKRLQPVAYRVGTFGVAETRSGPTLRGLAISRIARQVVRNGDGGQARRRRVATFDRVGVQGLEHRVRVLESRLQAEHDAALQAYSILDVDVAQSLDRWRLLLEDAERALEAIDVHPPRCFGDTTQQAFVLVDLRRRPRGRAGRVARPGVEAHAGGGKRDRDRGRLCLGGLRVEDDLCRRAEVGQSAIEALERSVDVEVGDRVVAEGIGGRLGRLAASLRAHADPTVREAVEVSGDGHGSLPPGRRTRVAKMLLDAESSRPRPNVVDLGGDVGTRRHRRIGLRGGGECRDQSDPGAQTDEHGPAGSGASHGRFECGDEVAHRVEAPVGFARQSTPHDLGELSRCGDLGRVEVLCRVARARDQVQHVRPGVGPTSVDELSERDAERELVTARSCGGALEQLRCEVGRRSDHAARRRES